MKKFLAVGINHFERPGNDLQGCIPDAGTMLKVAESLGIANNTNLTDARAVKSNVMGWLHTALSQARAGDLSYAGFSWSGHGTHYTQPAEEDGLGEALVCYDAKPLDGEWDPSTIITDRELKDILNQFPKTCRVEVWLDTCYSGGMDKALHGGSNRFIHAPDNGAGAVRVANTAMNAGLNSNVVMWCASSEGQTSADAYIKTGFHGAFTWFWYQRFLANGKMSRVDLLVATRKSLAANHFDQFPRLKCWNSPAQGLVGV